MTVKSPSPKTTSLLKRYKPKLYVAPGSFRPLSFYEDYLPQTNLKKSDGTVIDTSPNRDDLMKYHLSESYYLNYQRTAGGILNAQSSSGTVPLYGRVYSDTVAWDTGSIKLTFLKYSVVFPFSGLPAANSWWKEAGAHLMGAPWEWHELDIHGAIYVILHGTSNKPLGIMLAQHNYHETLLRGTDFQWPDNGRIRISFAKRSNEPYLITDRRGTRIEPTIGNPADLLELYKPGWFRPVSAGYDRIVAPGDGAITIPTAIKQLPPGDPLYTSLMDLGDRRKLFGYWPIWYREGPPGINYYAPPPLKNLADLAAFWYINENDKQFFELWRKYNRDWRTMNWEPLIRYQEKDFYHALRK
jgi:hypothetical protein